MTLKFLLPLLIFTKPLFASEEKPSENPPIFGYMLDLQMGYVDSLKNPLSSAAIGSQSADEENREQAIGLTRSRLQLSWELLRSSRATLVLRPDAMIEDRERGYDGRAGDPYLERASVNLLDAYSVERLFGDDFVVGIGVYEEFLRGGTSYDQVAEFGLEVQLPQKFSALRFGLDLFDLKADTAQPPEPQGYQFNFFVFQGNDDRSEVLAANDDAYDRSPSSNDAHTGIALALTRADGLFSHFGLLVGMHDNRYEEEPVTDADTGETTYINGKRNEVFAKVFEELYFAGAMYDTKLSLMYKVAKEKWKGDHLSISPRTHQSFALTTSMRVAEAQWAMVGAHYGTSDYTNDLSYHGYQFDIGYRANIGQGLNVSFMLSEERRVGESGGETVDGFSNESDSTKVLDRYSLSIDYIVDAT